MLIYRGGAFLRFLISILLLGSVCSNIYAYKYTHIYNHIQGGFLFLFLVYYWVLYVPIYMCTGIHIYIVIYREVYILVGTLFQIFDLEAYMFIYICIQVYTYIYQYIIWLYFNGFGWGGGLIFLPVGYPFSCIFSFIYYQLLIVKKYYQHSYNSIVNN